MLYFSFVNMINVINTANICIHSMFPDLLVGAQTRIFEGTNDVKFVGIEPVNDICIKLDIKAKDISSGKFFFYHSRTVFMRTCGNELFQGCTGGSNGFYRWLGRQSFFQKYLTGNEEEQAGVLAICKEKLPDLQLPEVLNKAVEYILESRMNTEQIKEYFNEVASEENAYIMLDTVSREEFQISGQFVLLTTDRKFLATKMFGVKKDSQGVKRSGFGFNEELSARDRPPQVQISNGIHISNGPFTDMFQMINAVMSQVINAQMNENNNGESASEENSEPVIVPPPNPKLAAYEQMDQNNNVEVTVDVVPVSENSNNEVVVQESTDENSGNQDSEDEEDNVEFVRTLFTEEDLEQLESEAIRNEDRVTTQSEEIVEENAEQLTTQVEGKEEETTTQVEDNAEEVVKECSTEEATIPVEENAEQVIKESSTETSTTQTEIKKEGKAENGKTKGLVIALFVLSILIAAGLVGLSFFYTKKKVEVDDI